MKNQFSAIFSGKTLKLIKIWWLLIVLGIVFLFGAFIFLEKRQEKIRERNKDNIIQSIINKGNNTQSSGDNVNSFLEQANIEAAIEYSNSHMGDAIYILENGNLIAEDYKNGYSKNTPHILASGTKSFNGVILAALIEDGYVDSFDQKVSDVIFEWKNDPNYPTKADITLRELLSLSSGLEPGQIGSVPTYTEAIANPLPTEKRGTFQYGPAPFQVFGEYVKRVVIPHGYTNAADYARKRFLTPAGVSISQWNKEKQGEPAMAGGVSMTASEWAEFGNFMINWGKVNDKQIVRPDLLKELIKPSKNHSFYGIGFWLTTGSSVAEAESANVDFGKVIPGNGFYAAGKGKQRLYVVPDYKISIVRFGQEDKGWDDEEFLNILFGK